MAKSNYTVHEDGSVTFEGDVSDSVRQKAYEEAAALVATRERAAATQVDPEEVKALAVESAELTAERAHATDVEQEAKK